LIVDFRFSICLTRNPTRSKITKKSKSKNQNRKFNMLHVTNGDAAVPIIRAAGVEGDVLPWRDVLHEGPVVAPATLDSLRPLRAKFLASPGGSAVEIARELEERDRRLGAIASDKEVTLWFEHDLYDQLQLAQILDWCATARKQPPYNAPRLTLIQADNYLGLMAPAQARTLWESRRDVTDAQLEAAQRAWGAFASDDPRVIEIVLDEVAALPFMRAALVRHLEEFPAVENGLSRTERQALETLVVGSWPFHELFQAAHIEREDPFFLGDLVFLERLKALASGDEPLVRMDNEKVWLTDAGRAVLAGTRDRVETLGIDRWLGGVHLKGRQVPFRWDSEARLIVSADSRHK
jgi:hypothetical protein